MVKHACLGLALACAMVWPVQAETGGYVSVTQVFSLGEALQRALNENPALRATEETAGASRAVARARMGAFLPRVEAAGSWGVATSDARDSAGQREKSLHPMAQTLTVVQPLTLAEETANVVAARASSKAFGADVLAARQNTLQNVVDAYTGILVQKTAVSSTLSLIAALQSQSKAAQARFRTGEGTKTDMAQANARLTQAKAQLAEAEGQLAVRRQQLVGLVGALPVGAEFAWPTLPTVARSSSTTPEAAVAYHPQLVAAQARARSKRAEAFGAGTAALPEISARLQAARTEEQVNRTNGPTDTRSLTIQATMPLFQGGQVFSAVQAARAQARSAEYELQDLQNTLAANLLAAEANVSSAKLSAQAAEESLQAQQTATKGYRLEYKYGERSFPDLLDAERELNTATLQAAQARQAAVRAAYGVLAARGELTQLPPQP